MLFDVSKFQTQFVIDHESQYVVFVPVGGVVISEESTKGVNAVVPLHSHGTSMVQSFLQSSVSIELPSSHISFAPVTPFPHTSV